MKKILCEANWAGECILRVTTRDEELYIPRHDCALLVEDSGEQIEQGYALYLLDSTIEDQSCNWHSTMKTDIHYCALPKDSYYEPGQFLHILAEGQSAEISILPTDDLPDRTLFLTGKCNSNCIMCPYTTKWREKAEDTPYSLLLRYVELMNPYAPYLCVTGGEPSLLRSEFIELLSHIKAHFSSCLLHVLTNGRAFCYTDFFEAFRKVRPLKTLLGIPIYAHTKELHDAITLTPGSFDETTTGLDILYAAGEHIELRIVLTALNVPTLCDLACFIHNRYPNVYMVSIMGLEMMGNAFINRNQVWINYDDLFEELSKAVDYLVQNGIQTQIYNMPLCKVNRRHWALCQKSISAEKVSFFPECEQCGIRSTCGGFFFTTMHMPDIQIVPYQEA